MHPQACANQTAKPMTMGLYPRRFRGLGFIVFELKCQAQALACQVLKLEMAPVLVRRTYGEPDTIKGARHRINE